jgi:histidine phosphotransferase ChpT
MFHSFTRGPALQDRPDIAALLGSRICHDLISPIGAIGNGVELLMLEGGPAGPEVALISESVAHANARVRFFRIAFGAAGRDQRIARSEVQDILAAMTRGGRVSAEWDGPADLSRREVKLAFLLILCLETALPQGGRIRIERGEARWLLEGQGPRLRIDADLWEVLSNPAAQAEIGPSQVHFLLVQDETARQHRRLTVETAENAVKLTF